MIKAIKIYKDYSCHDYIVILCELKNSVCKRRLIETIAILYVEYIFHSEEIIRFGHIHPIIDYPTVYPRSHDPFNLVIYKIKLVKTFWTYGMPSKDKYVDLCS